MSVRALSLALCLVAAPSLAQKAAPGAEVDWAELVVRVTGSGPPDFRAQNPAHARLAAERSAREDAVKAVLAKVVSLPVASGQTLGALFPEGPARQALVDLVRKFRVREKRYYSDHGLQVDVEVPLGMLLAAAVTAPATGEVNSKGEGAFTGLLVDARGLGCVPHLMPRLVDAGGRVLYGAEWVSPEARTKLGVAAFFTGLERASAHPRVGDRPLVIKAAAVKGQDVVLGEEAVRALRGARNAWLTDGRVGVVVQ
jgi:hypothetical protein